MATDSEERLARNEALFREVNERIRDAADRHGSDRHPYEFLCECADTACTDRIELTLVEYEQVRGDGRRFVLAPGHSVPKVETVVAATPEYVVVEKVGVAGEIADVLDPRDGEAA